MAKGKSEHHGKAVHFQESATKHHRAAELEYGSGDHKKAAHDAKISGDNGGHASHHAEVAAGEMLEHHGLQPAPAKPRSQAKTGKHAKQGLKARK